MASHDTPKSRYDEAGVSISRGNELVQRIKHRVAVTNRSEVIGGIGGFGGLFDLSGQRYRNPVLVSGTDGVGTKLRLAIETGRHDSIGIDLVAMCVNDLLVLGAEPLFFLDYYATGQLDVDVAESVITGIIEGCRQAGCALLGGETAEMPGMYASEDYDLAGFCVGVVEKDGIIDGSRIRPGQAVLALASSGAHSNGYSLIRKVLADSGVATDTPLDGRTLIDTLLTPTRIYVRSLLALAADLDVLGMAHITGGGLIENIPRVLPQTVRVELDPDSWQWPALFHWLQEQGRIDTTEMHTVFNCGVGMVVIVDAAGADRALGILHSHGETAWQIGTTAACEPGAAQVIFV